VSRRKDEARRTGAGDGEGDSSKTGRVPFISAPTVCFTNAGFRDRVKGGAGRTGHMNVFFLFFFFLGGRAPLMEVSFFLPGFDVKGGCSRFDNVVRRAVFNIHAADREKERGKIFWSNRKLICG